jgi:ribonuclease HII
MHRPLLHPVGAVLPEAGCDEAGRGCLAGPVFAAAVILPERMSDALRMGLRDSKQLHSKAREVLRGQILQEAVASGVAWVGNEAIDRMNILQASIQAMHLAIGRLAVRPAFLLVDGNRFRPFDDIPHRCCIGGDGRFAAIAAASILAKTARDEHMQQQHRLYPQYGWDRNMGYPTKQHREALLQWGPSPLHRRSFRPVFQLAMDLQGTHDDPARGVLKPNRK